jgi:3-oxoacyl-[acyl-carrier protein] reductase
MATAIGSFGQIHALVNCAGASGRLGLRSHEVDLEEFDRVYEVNLRGALVISQAIIPHMIENSYGRIAHVASMAGKEGNPGMTAYSATKAGLIGMVKTQAKEYAASGIIINALAPGVIRGAWVERQPRDVMASLEAKIPIGRPGEASEAAEILCWMVSRACSFTTGFTFDLSGGRATY